MAAILFLTQVLPYPLNAGPKVRAYYMLRHLSAAHEVTLVSFVRPDDTPQAVDHLRSFCHAVHPVPMQRAFWRNVRAGLKGMATGLPIVIARDDSQAMVATLHRLTRETRFAIVHADQLSMAGYARLAARPDQARTVLDAHNAIHVLARRMADEETNPLRRVLMRREARAFVRYERRMCRDYDAVLTVTPADKRSLLSLFPQAMQQALAEKFAVVPISVAPEQTPPIARVPGGPPTILHIGTMFWPPNAAGVLWFAREVLPRIHQQIPEARFVVVGKSPPREVQALADDPHIEVTGYVDDPTRWLAAADAFIVPLNAGSGMRVKILDAWLWGLPIVSTPLGAEGIEIRPDENILIAGDAPAFAEATVELLADSRLNGRMRQSGRAWVEQKYAWKSVYQSATPVYERLLAGRPHLVAV